MKRQIWTPAPIAIVEQSVFSSGEIAAYEREILANSKATELDASRFFAKHPKFLHLGHGVDLRREVVLVGSAAERKQRVDFFRRSYGRPFWDLVELKDPNKPFIVGADGLHPRLNSEIDKAINQALDYRDLMTHNIEIRKYLQNRGISICRPQILVVVGTRDEHLSQEMIEVLYDRVRQRGPIEAWSYNDIYDFAKEHYDKNHLVTVPGLHLSDNPQLGRDLAWDSFLEHLSVAPEIIYGLAPREFEEFIAFLLYSFGYDVELTTPSRDGGGDIVAVLDEVAKTKLLIECKRYSPERKVGVSHVRSLYGIAQAIGATKGILVTSSHFTQEAMRFMESLKWSLEGKDLDGILGWVDMYHQLQRGAVLPVLRQP